MLLFWRLGYVSGMSFIQYTINLGAQYGGSAAGSFADLGPKVLLEPLLGLGTGFQFIRAGATWRDRRSRAACLASFLATSGAALQADPATNAALGGASRRFASFKGY